MCFRSWVEVLNGRLCHRASFDPFDPGLQRRLGRASAYGLNTSSLHFEIMQPATPYPQDSAGFWGAQSGTTLRPFLATCTYNCHPSPYSCSFLSRFGLSTRLGHWQHHCDRRPYISSLNLVGLVRVSVRFLPYILGGQH